MIGEKLMNSIKTTKKEKEILRNIALKIINNCKNCLRSLETESMNSYYLQVSRKQAEYLRTYTFDTVAELRTELTNLWKNDKDMQEFISVVLASTFKECPFNMSNYEPTLEHKDSDNDNLLPTYTYTI